MRMTVLADVAEPYLECTHCSAVFPLSLRYRGCDRCGASVMVVSGIDWFRRSYSAFDAGATSGGVALSFPGMTDVAGLGEGDTPLRPRPDLASHHGIGSLWLKDETRNPSGTYKDRLNSVASSMLSREGATRAVTSSTGNQAVSAALYGRMAGLEIMTFIPDDVPPMAARLVSLYGGIAHVLPWDQRSAAIRPLVEEKGWGYIGRNASGPLANPFGLEGYKSIAAEVFRGLGGRVPDLVVMPSCGGDGITGVWRGFESLRLSGISDSVPRMAAVQPRAAASLVRAVSLGLESVEPVAMGETIAHSLRDSRSGDHGLASIRTSGGTAVAVDDEQLRASLSELAGSGIFAEPAAGAGLAGLDQVLDSLSPEERQALTVVVIVTGSGNRWPDSLDATRESPSNRNG